MEITLSPEAEQFVREQVQEATYPDVSAVIEAAVSIWRLACASTPDIPGEEPWTKESLRAAIQVGLDQLDRGECAEWDVEAIKAEGRRLLKARKRARQSACG